MTSFDFPKRFTTGMATYILIDVLPILLIPEFDQRMDVPSFIESATQRELSPDTRLSSIRYSTSPSIAGILRLEFPAAVFLNLQELQLILVTIYPLDDLNPI